jgi:hypothetical protein
MSISIVASMLKRTRKTLRDSFPRAVGLLLVLFIFYGTTVQAAHNHFRTVDRTADNTLSIGKSGLDKNLTTNPGCNDCLICQLHQSFSTTLISIKSDLKPSSLRSKQSAPTLDLMQSETTAPQTGRGPPKTN